MQALMNVVNAWASIGLKNWGREFLKIQIIGGPFYSAASTFKIGGGAGQSYIRFNFLSTKLR